MMRSLWSSTEPMSSDDKAVVALLPTLALLRSAVFASLAFPPSAPSFPSDGGDPRARAAEELLRAHGLTNSADKRSAEGGHAQPPPQKAPSEPSARAYSVPEIAIPSSSGSHHDGAASSSGAQCPLRKVPFFSKVVNAIVSWEPVKMSGFKLDCPAPIVAMRAALARTPPVKALRPKPLIAKFGAVGATSFLVNVPLGAWREHCRKFSPEWFLAVHASIPLVMSLRKAVVMPTIAILVTITCAVSGQFVGSRLERARCLAAKESRAKTVVHAGAGAGEGDADSADTQRRASTDRGGSARGPASRRRGMPSMPSGPVPHGLVAGVR